MNDDNPHIPNDKLRLADIPPFDSSWEIISDFALTFDGYEELGSFEKCAEVADQHKHSTLTELRACLFFEQRRWRHFDAYPNEEAMHYIVGLVKQIHAMVVNDDKSTSDMMTKEIELFLEIVKEVSEGKIQARITDPLNVIFAEGLTPTEFEMALYSLEAMTHREIAQDFYEGAIEDHLAKSIGSFLRECLSQEITTDPLFIAKVFKKFYQSAKWENEEKNEPGNN